MNMKKMKGMFFGMAAGILAAGLTAASCPAYAETGAENSAEAGMENGTEAEKMTALYRVYENSTGWSEYTADNTYATVPEGSNVTAIQATLRNQPEGMSGTIAYRVNLSGSGWLDWQENFTEAGDSAGTMPLEAVKVALTGQLAEQYDVYYSVYQNGSWTEQVMNGETAGTEGCGLWVRGLRIAVRMKGEEAPTVAQETAIDPAKPMVALTFDDGPSSATSRILDSLEANDARATFYIVGNRMGNYPETIRRMAALGCEFGNHTWDHTYLTKLSAAAMHSNLNQMDTTLQNIAGVRTTTVRPPGGFVNDSVRQALAAYGTPGILWSIDTLDWKTRNAQSTINCVLGNVRDGDIILMHDLYGTTADAAAVLIPELKKRGYQLVTVSELAANRGGMQPGQIYTAFRP